MFTPEQLDRVWHSLSADRDFTSQFASDVGSILDNYTDANCHALQEYLIKRIPSVRDPYCQGILQGLVSVVDGVRIERRRCSV